jgi:hypothetical protein
MTTLTQKLRHNRGASITLALLFFLMCILVAGTVLAAASAAAARAAARDDEQQAYLAVSSAVEFVRDDLANAAEFKAVIEKSQVGTITTVKGSTFTPDDVTDCVLWQLLYDGAVAIQTGSAVSYPIPLTFSGITGVDEVTLNFTMDGTYNIICTFKTDESLYTMSLVSQATTTTSTHTVKDGDNAEITETFTVTWGPATIEKGVATT